MKNFLQNQSSLLIILLFFSVMIWIDLSWSKLSILEMKSIDEYAFHGSLLRVYEGLVSFDVKKIFSHGFYSYGSTFFIINGLAAFPWLEETGSSFAIITPRLITTLFMAVTLFIMTKLVEQFHKNIFEKILALLFVIAMPGIWINAMWFHPDYMMTTFLMASMYMLFRSNKIGDGFYWLSVLFWGISVAVKVQAITFAPVLIWSVLIMIRNKSGSEHFVQILAASFVSIVIIFIVLNPYVIHPKGANAWFQVFISNIESNASNHGRVGELSLEFKIKNAIELFYVPMVLFIMLLLLSLIAIYKEWNSKQLRLSGMAAAYILPNTLYLLIFVNKAWNHYYLPIFIMAPLIFSFGINLLRDRFSLNLISLRATFILLVVTQIVAFSPALKDLIELRMNGGAISADSINRYKPQIVYESDERDKENEVYELIKEDVKHDSIFLKSPYLPFPFKDSELSYEQVRLIFGALSPASIERRVSRSGIIQKEATHILIKKDDIYFDENKIQIMSKIDAYKIAEKTIQQWILGEGQYSLIKQSSCCYLFEKNKEERL
jgi:hypothetical protein